MAAPARRAAGQVQFVAFQSTTLLGAPGCATANQCAASGEPLTLNISGQGVIR